MNTAAGPWALGQECNPFGERDDKMITITFPPVEAPTTVASTAGLVTPLPPSLWPAAPVRFAVEVEDNSAIVFGTLTIDGTGGVVIGVGAGLGPFQTSGQSGWPGITVSYTHG